MNFYVRLALGLAAVLGVGIAFTFEYPPITVEQRGYRGLAIEQNHTEKALATLAANNVVPAAADPQEPSGVKSSAAYENIQVLGDLDSNEFLRLMTSITEWVAPEEGCTYCHSEENLADDSKYTKIVARRMLQMTAHINATWQPHVAQTVSPVTHAIAAAGCQPTSGRLNRLSRVRSMPATGRARMPRQGSPPIRPCPMTSSRHISARQLI